MTVTELENLAVEIALENTHMSFEKFYEELSKKWYPITFEDQCFAEALYIIYETKIEELYREEQFQLMCEFNQG